MEHIGLEPIKLTPCKGILGALPMPHRNWRPVWVLIPSRQFERLIATPAASQDICLAESRVIETHARKGTERLAGVFRNLSDLLSIMVSATVLETALCPGPKPGGLPLTQRTECFVSAFRIYRHYFRRVDTLETPLLSSRRSRNEQAHRSALNPATPGRYNMVGEWRAATVTIRALAILEIGMQPLHLQPVSLPAIRREAFPIWKSFCQKGSNALLRFSIVLE